jgi:hypothetical protein
MPDGRQRDPGSGRRPPAHAAERGDVPDRLPALAVRRGPLDGSRPAAREHRLDREDGEGVRRPHHPLHGQRRVGTRSADRAGACRAARGQPADRPDDPQRVGGRRLPRGGARNRAPQADRVRALDGDLPGVPRPRRTAGRVRRLSRRRRGRGNIRRGPPGRPPDRKFQQRIDMGERAWSAAKPTQPKGDPP